MTTPPKGRQGRGGKRVGAGRKPGKTDGRIERERKERVAKTIVGLATANEKAGAPQVLGPPPKARKQAVDVMREFMDVYAGMAAFYQPSAPTAAFQNQHFDEKNFRFYAREAVDTAAKLAPFESATFKAQAVMTMPAPPPERPRGDNVIDLNDPNHVARQYRRMMQGGGE